VADPGKSRTAAAKTGDAAGGSARVSLSHARPEAAERAALQRALGNRATGRLVQSAALPGIIDPDGPRALRTASLLRRLGADLGLRAGDAEIRAAHPTGTVLQAKLNINAPGDRFEQEADRVAEQVLRTPDGAVGESKPASRAPALVRRRVSGGGAGIEQALPIVDEVLSLPGQPLDSATRAFFEPRFGHDFGRVRIHSGAQATSSAEGLNTRAYTVGEDIVLARRPSQLTTGPAGSLMAHELAHVVQQTGGNLDCRAGPLSSSGPRVARAPGSDKGEEPSASPASFHGLAVEHGAFNITLQGGRVVVDDAGVRGTLSRPEVEKIAAPALESAVALIPGKVINEFRISHLHQDHINLVDGLRRKGFTIEMVVINLFQLDFAPGQRATLISALDGTTTLRVLHYVSGGLVAHDVAVAEFSQEWLDQLRDMATDAPITRAYREPGYSAHVVPSISSSHRELHSKTPRPRKAPPDTPDTFSTIGVDDSVPGARMVQGSDLRIKDWLLFGPDTELDETLREKAPPLTVWLMTHHLSSGFLKSGRKGGQPEEILKFLDQMMSYRLAPTEGGAPGRHVVSASVEAENLAAAIPYLFHASGFETVLSQAGTPVIVEGAKAGASAQVTSGHAWSGPVPTGSPLLDSYQILQRLSPEDRESHRALIQQLVSARVEFVRRVLVLPDSVAMSELVDAFAKQSEVEDLTQWVVQKVLEADVPYRTRIRASADFAGTSDRAAPSDEAVAAGIANGLREQASLVNDLVAALATALRAESPPDEGGGGALADSPMPALASLPTDMAAGVDPGIAAEGAIAAAGTSATLPTREASGSHLPSIPQAAQPSRSAPLLLPDYEIFDPVPARALEPVMVRPLGAEALTVSGPPAEQSSSQATQRRPPIATLPGSSPAEVFASTPAARDPVASIGGENITARAAQARGELMGLPPKSGAPVSQTEPLVDPPIRWGELSESATSPPAPLLSAKGEAVATGAALMVDAMARQLSGYMTEVQTREAQDAVSDLKWRILSKLKSKPDMGVIITVAYSQPMEDVFGMNPTGPRLFLWASFDLVPGQTLSEARASFSYAVPEPQAGELRDYRFQWFPPATSSEEGQGWHSVHWNQEKPWYTRLHEWLKGT
jgi:hypothetical protein